jgi:hypothetical protein
MSEHIKSGGLMRRAVAIQSAITIEVSWQTKPLLPDAHFERYFSG